MLNIRLLGGWQLEHGSIQEGSPPSPRLQALLAYLLLHQDAPQSRAHLAYLLWPDSEEAQARTNLRQALHYLRRWLPDADRFVGFEGRHLHWRAGAPCTLDVRSFEQACTHARTAQAEGNPAEARACLERAVQLYRGDLLPELYEAWLEPERERLCQMFAAALEDLAGLSERQGDYQTAVPFAQQLVRHDPLNEASYRRLIRLHAHCGEWAKALRVYRECVATLERELAVEPSAGTQALHAQVTQQQVTPAPALESNADAPPFVGRQEAWSHLQEAHRAAMLGRPALMLVKGESGIGKSRLAGEFARGVHANEVATAATRCYAAEGALAFAPVTALLRTPVLRPAVARLEDLWLVEITRLLPEVSVERPELTAPVPLTQSWQRQRLFEALARAVLASQPLLLVLDDLQWCDRETLEWLHYLLRFDPEARLLVIGTARTHQLGDNAGLGELLAALQRADLLAELELPPLERSEVELLVRSLSKNELEEGETDAIFRETEGNPLFVVEIMRHGVPAKHVQSKGLPPKLQGVIAGRLKRLSASAQELASMAAVIGREFSFELLVKVADQAEDTVVRSLEELWRQHIVREQSAGRFDFTHDKLREVAYAELSQTRRQILHRYTAEALEALHPTDVECVSAQVAHHYDRADSPERAIPCYQQAAVASQRLYANDDATHHYRRALELVERLPASAGLESWRRKVTAQLFEGMGDVIKLSGAHDRTRGSFERALEQVPSSSRLWRARLWRKVAATWTAQYRYDQALPALDAATAALGSASADEETAWWQAWLEVQLARGHTYYWLLQWHELEALLQEAEPVLRRYGNARHRIAFFKARAHMLMTRDRFGVSDETLSHGRALLAAAQETGDLHLIAKQRFGLGVQHLFRHELSEAQAQLEVALEVAEKTGDALLRARCLVYSCFAYRKLGDLARTRQVAERSLEAATKLAMPECIAATRGHLAWLAWKQGDLVTAVRESLLAQELWPQGQDYPIRWSALYPLMAARLRQGQLTLALECAQAMLDRKQQRLPDAVTQALENALKAGAQGQRAEAKRWLERSIPAAEQALLL